MPRRARWAEVERPVAVHEAFGVACHHTELGLGVGDTRPGVDGDVEHASGHGLEWARLLLHLSSSATLRVYVARR